MINTSNEYKKYISDSVNSTLSRDFTAKADIELASSTVLNITEEDIVAGGLKINDATSASNSFQIGSAIINQCTLMLNNIGGKFNQYDFTDATIRPYIGLKLSETTEWITKGIFTVDESTVANSVISLVALDNMYKFDTPFSDVTIDFPCTAFNLLYAICEYCDVPLATINFLNKDYIIRRKSDDKATTCREIISYIAQIAGCFARCNTNGALELKWYDIGAFETEIDLDGGTFDDGAPSYTSGDSADGGDFTFTETTNYNGGTFADMRRYHHIYAINQATIATDDIIITGVQVKAQGMESDYGETVLFGSSGYVIEITNPLIQENTANTIASSVGVKIVGMRFRPLSISALSDPSIEAGDVAYVTDRKGNSYQTLISNLNYTIGKFEGFSCDAETPSKKQSVRYDASTKAIIEARNQAKQALSTYELAVKQLNNLVMHSFGVYHTSEKLEDGSTIEYSHDKPTLAESQNIWKQTADTFTVSNDGGVTWRGMDADGNMVATVLNAIGINAEWINVGTLRGVRIEAEEGKVANMDIADNGFVIDNESEHKNFIIQVGNTRTEYINGEYKMETRYMNNNYNLNEEYKANFELGGNGFRLCFENSDNTVNCGINIFHGTDGRPVLNLYTRGEEGLYDGIEINGYKLWNRIQRIDDMEYDIMRIKTLLKMS